MPTEQPARPRSLFHHHDFRQLWIGDTASQVGVSLAGFAVPYLAVTVLHAQEFQMGLLDTLTRLGFLLIGLPSGALIDRWLKRSVMITADIGRAALWLTIPLAWWMGWLSFPQLLIVATLAGMMTVFFDVSYQSYLPTLVHRDQVVEGNAKLQASQSVSQVAGPGLAGGLITWLGAPVVIAVNAVGYLASAFFLGRIRHREVAPPKEDRRPLVTEISEGLQFVVRHPLLRRLIACTGIANLFASITATMTMLLMVRELQLNAPTIGIIEASMAVGGLLGALLAAPLTRLIGEGMSIISTTIAMLVLSFFWPLATVLPPVPTLIAGGALTGAMIVAYNIATVSFRQRLCPPALLGRMNASARFLVWGTMPIGAMLGGLLGSSIGLVPTLWVGAIGGCLAALPVLISPLWGMRKLPDHDEESAEPVAAS